jgi:hypothetical protein
MVPVLISESHLLKQQKYDTQGNFTEKFRAHGTKRVAECLFITAQRTDVRGNFKNVKIYKGREGS